MDQSRDYRELGAELPEGVEPGQDGLVIELADQIFHNICYATLFASGNDANVSLPGRFAGCGG